MCWNEGIIVPMIWASALVLFVITGAVAYVRSCRWKAVEKQGWPKQRIRSASSADIIEALGKATPTYTYTTVKEPVKDDN